MSWTALALIGAALLTLVAVARWRRLAESRLADAETACRLAEDALVGFTARDALVGGDGRAALIAGNGALTVLRRDGSRITARRLVPPLRVLPAVEGVTLFSGDRAFGDVLLFGVTDTDVGALAARAAEPSWLARGPGR